MSDYIPFQLLYFAILPVLLDEEAIPYHTSVLTGSLRYEELLNHRNPIYFRDEVRMDKNTFLLLLDKLKSDAGLTDSVHVSAGVKLLMYIRVLKGNTNRETSNHWQHSFSTTHDCLYEVAKHS